MSNTKFTDGYRGGQRASCDCVRGSKREPIVFRDDVTIKIDSSGVGFTLGARDFKGVQCVVTYQKVTGCLSPGAHPGGANGQDAYTDLIVSSGGIEMKATCIGNGQVHDAIAPSYEVSKTLNCMSDPMKVMVDENVSKVRQNVRRLTPLECERLQGYPDGWTDLGEWNDTNGKMHKPSDSARYKALGNSIALPFWQYLARRICAQYDRDIMMGSLFDGIGGFPLVFERCGAKAVWASEIEEFPIAVTKKHFPEEGEEK